MHLENVFLFFNMKSISIALEQKSSRQRAIGRTPTHDQKTDWEYIEKLYPERAQGGTVIHSLIKMGNSVRETWEIDSSQSTNA